MTVIVPSCCIADDSKYEVVVGVNLNFEAHYVKTKKAALVTASRMRSNHGGSRYVAISPPGQTEAVIWERTVTGGSFGPWQKTVNDCSQKW